MSWLNPEKCEEEALPVRPEASGRANASLARNRRRPWHWFRLGLIRLDRALASPLAALLVAAGLSALLYWQSFVRPLPLLEMYTTPRLDGTYLYQFGWPAAWRFLLSFLALGLLYALAWGAARRLHGRPAWVIVIGGALLFSLLFLYMAPFDSADIYDNIVHGRILGIYNDNPFVQVGRLYFPRDPFVVFMGWKSAPSAYGPLWELLAGFTAKLAGRKELATVLAFKALSGVFVLGSALIVALLLNKVAPKQALAGTLLLAWNPVVLYETWGNGHNDMVMMFWVLLAVLALIYRRYTLAVLALLVGALIKYLPVLMIPTAGLIALVQLKGGWARLRFVVITGLASLALVALSWSPFWGGPLSNLKEILTIDRRMKLFSATVPATLYKALQVYRPALDMEAVGEKISLVAFALTILFALASAVWAVLPAQLRRAKAGSPAVWRSMPWARFTQAAFSLLAFYLLFTNLWFQQWYTVWLVALAPLLAGRSRRLALLFGFAALGKQFFIGPHLFWKPPIPEQPGLELEFTLGSLGIPLVYALWAALRAVWKPGWEPQTTLAAGLERLEVTLNSLRGAAAAVPVETVNRLLKRIPGDRRRRP